MKKEKWEFSGLKVHIDKRFRGDSPRLEHVLKQDRGCLFGFVRICLKPENNETRASALKYGEHYRLRKDDCDDLASVEYNTKYA